MKLFLPIASPNQADFNRRVAQAVNGLLSDADGDDETAISAVCDVAAPIGTPLAVSRSNGHLVKADASSKPLSFVAGLAHSATAVGFVSAVQREVMTLADWTAITGSASLLQGQTYFLAVGGGLTTVPPASPNNLTVVGEAASPTTLIIQPQNPIQL